MLARPPHYRSANAQCFVLLAHFLLESMIGSVGPGLSVATACWHFARECCQDQETNITLLENSIGRGDDLTEEKRHAAAITGVAEFGQ
jgi:hypothetical protein